jgi:hypothetical protein
MTKKILIFLLAMMHCCIGHAVISITNIQHTMLYEDNGFNSYYDACKGRIDVTATGNAGPFTFLWSNGATTEDTDNLCAGAYAVTVTNAYGCTKVLRASIILCNEEEVNPNAPLLSPVHIQEAKIVPCDPFSSLGGIDIVVVPTNSQQSAGVLYYEWINQTTGEVVGDKEDLLQVLPGTYCVTITNGCMQPVSECYTLELCSYAIPGGAFDLDFVFSSPCPKGTTGAIDLSVAGVPEPFTYEWRYDNTLIATTQDITQRPPGYHFVKVTDDNGCFYSEMVNLPARITDIKLIDINQSCGVNPSGKIEIQAQPIGSYQYQWSTGFSETITGASTIANLAPGEYCVTITDPVSGCTQQNCWTIYDGIPASAIQVADRVITCRPNNPSCSNAIELSVQYSVKSLAAHLGSYAAILPRL